jgi:DNA-binding CsgD family transcriptional regulator
MSPDEDQFARVAQLTEAQLRCVRLISTGSSKHIALKIGISHRTVDQHICGAMLRLGVCDRYAARALVASWDARHPEILPTQAADIADARDRTILETPYATGLFQREIGEVREASVDYVADFQAVSPRAAATEECSRHETSGLQTAAKIVGLTLSLVIILSAAEPLGRGFESLANFILHLRN